MYFIFKLFKIKAMYSATYPYWLSPTTRFVESGKVITAHYPNTVSQAVLQKADFEMAFCERDGKDCP